MESKYFSSLCNSPHKWIFLALIAMGLACVYHILIKAVSAVMSVNMFLAGLFAFQVPFLALVIFSRRRLFNSPKLSRLSLSSLALCMILGIFGASGNIFEVYAVETAPNIGYVSAIKLGQIFLITMLGDLVSGKSNTRLIDFIYSLGVIVGIILITCGGLSNYILTNKQSLDWVWYSIGAMISFSVIILGTKYITRTMDASSAIFWLVASTAVYLIGYGHKDLIRLIMMADSYYYMLVCASAICIGAFNLFLSHSVAYAPNPGFPISITSLQVPVLTLSALIFFQDQTISMLAIFGSLVAMYSSFKLATAERKG